MLKVERYFVPEYGEYRNDAGEVCAHCGSRQLTYQIDQRRVYELWSPIRCDVCKGRMYEIWRGGKFLRRLGVKNEV